MGAFPEQRPSRLGQLVGQARLLQDAIDSSVQRATLVPIVTVAAETNHRYFREHGIAAHTLDEFKAIHSRQRKVGDDEIRRSVTH